MSEHGVSVLHLAQQIGDQTSTEKEICQVGFSLFPHKMQLSQPFSVDRVARHYLFETEYGTLPQENLGALNAIWSPDEAHYHLDGCITKKLPNQCSEQYCLSLDHLEHTVTCISTARQRDAFLWKQICGQQKNFRF
jgi:hypothetical protein